MSMKTMIRSKRIYLDETTANELCNQIDSFNEAVRYTYNLLFDIEYSGKTITDASVYIHLQTKYKTFSVYYLNSIINEAKAMLSSQRELIKLHIEEKQAKIDSINQKIEAEMKKLTKYEGLKEQFIARSKAMKEGCIPPVFKPYFGSNIYCNKQNPNILFIRKGYGKKAKVEQVSFTEAECYNQSRIKKIKSKIGLLIGKRNRLQEKLNLLTMQLNKQIAPKKVCFGSKQFFKLKDTTDMDVTAWKNEFHYRRNHAMLISGKSEGGYGNLVFKYHADTNTMDFFTSEKKLITIHNVVFPYGGEALKNELNNKNHGSIAYRLLKHYDKNNKLYFIIQAILTLPEKTSYFIPHNGVVSIDINPDRIDLTELNGYGCMIHREVFKLDLSDKTTNQTTNILNNLAAQVIDYCAKVQKPLVMEDLDFEETKQKLMYQDKGYKQMLTSFAYKHITTAFESRAYKQDVYLKKVNPAFTSMLAKTKYMRKMRLPIHTIAAMVIGRRGMGFEEKLPAIYSQAINFDKCKTDFAKYSKLNKKTKDIPIHYFYQKIDDFKAFLKANKRKTI